jgi:hypothetical protein
MTLEELKSNLKKKKSLSTDDPVEKAMTFLQLSSPSDTLVEGKEAEEEVEEEMDDFVLALTLLEDAHDTFRSLLTRDRKDNFLSANQFKDIVDLSESIADLTEQYEIETTEIVEGV